MNESELLILIREAKTSCLDCYRISKTPMQIGTVVTSPTREQVMKSALDSLSKVMNNGDRCYDDSREAIARCNDCDYNHPEGPMIFEYLRKQMA